MYNINGPWATRKESLFRTLLLIARLKVEKEIPEYWIVDWENKTVEIYLLDYENEQPAYFLRETVTESNKEKLRIISMPIVKMDFDELFDTEF